MIKKVKAMNLKELENLEIKLSLSNLKSEKKKEFYIEIEKRKEKLEAINNSLAENGELDDFE